MITTHHHDLPGTASSSPPSLQRLFFPNISPQSGVSLGWRCQGAQGRHILLELNLYLYSCFCLLLHLYFNVNEFVWLCDSGAFVPSVRITLLLQCVQTAAIIGGIFLGVLYSSAIIFSQICYGLERRSDTWCLRAVPPDRIQAMMDNKTFWNATEFNHDLEIQKYSSTAASLQANSNDYSLPVIARPRSAHDCNKHWEVCLKYTWS